ncbi:Prefoldin subunit 2 [Armadillidium vulgare]|nr:Prefoldin subunit 2 [Armadillidium vulgare]
MAGPKMDQQEIVQNFQQMRNEQRSLMGKISELEQDLNETQIRGILAFILRHRRIIGLSYLRVVIETLEEVSPKRKCFRMIGGVLVEKTVEEILPALVHNRNQLSKLIENLNEKLVAKGKEINEFREKHGIRIRGQEDLQEKTSQSTSQSGKDASTGVLVANKS